jgi:hypothetical protein
VRARSAGAARLTKLHVRHRVVLQTRAFPSSNRACSRVQDTHTHTIQDTARGKPLEQLLGAGAPPSVRAARWFRCARARDVSGWPRPRRCQPEPLRARAALWVVVRFGIRLEAFEPVPCIGAAYVLLAAIDFSFCRVAGLTCVTSIFCICICIFAEGQLYF